MSKFNMRKFQSLARVLRNYVQIDGQKQRVSKKLHANTSIHA